MAKLILTFLLFFFFVVSFSHARDLSDRSEDGVSAVEDSDSKASIFLPSEKLSEEYEASKSTAEPDQVRTEFNPSEITAAETTETGSDPLVVITFRPINRQLVRRSVPLMFRQGRRGCRHHHHSKPWRLADQAGQISYGNDMILSNERWSPNSGGNWGSDHEIAISSKLNEFRHVGAWDSSDGKEDRKHLHHHRFFHHHREEEDQEHKENSGFLRNFRKFLNQFEF